MRALLSGLYRRFRSSLKPNPVPPTKGRRRQPLRRLAKLSSRVCKSAPRNAEAVRPLPECGSTRLQKQCYNITFRGARVDFAGKFSRPPVRLLIALSIALLAAVTTARAGEGKGEVVAAENFYGNVAQQIGGDRVSVVSILNNPEQDPHLFEVSPAVIRQVAAARVVIYNGAGYDPWMQEVVGATAKPDRIAI